VKFEFEFSKEVFILLVKGMLSLILCLVSIYWLGYPNAYFAEAIIVMLTIWYCVYELNKRMNLKEIVLNFISKIKG
jgi:hypothetical protein